MKVDVQHLYRYLFSGGVAYITEMASLVMFREALGLSPVAAVAISFWVGFVAAFLLQKLVTFKNYERAVHRLAKQMGGYGLLTVWNYAFTLLLARLFARTTSIFVIRTGTIAIITLWNFFVYQKMFKNQDAVVN